MLNPAEKISDHPEIWEKVVNKLRTQTMPPLGAARPNDTQYETAATALETELDKLASANPQFGDFQANFAMALANQLTRRDSPPEHVEVRATVVLDQVDGAHRIVASRVPDQFAEPGRPARFAVPEGTFVSSNPGERLNLRAEQADGTQLPGWLRFSADSGTFEGTPPPGF